MCTETSEGGIDDKEKNLKKHKQGKQKVNKIQESGSGKKTESGGKNRESGKKRYRR